MTSDVRVIGSLATIVCNGLPLSHGIPWLPMPYEADVPVPEHLTGLMPYRRSVIIDRSPLRFIFAEKPGKVDPLFEAFCVDTVVSKFDGSSSN